MRVFHRFIITMVLLSLLIVLFPAVAHADETVTFPDPNLEAAIRDAIGKPSGDILISDLLVLIDFYAQAKGINNLSGLEYCTNLQWLYLDDNQINDISTLQYLTNLRVLGLTGNQISDVSPLQNLVQLWHLYLTDNQISDISAFHNLTNLTVLHLTDNQISDISTLQNLTTLQHLVLSSNQVIDISALENLTNLDLVVLYNNQIDDISALHNLTSLEFLNLSANQISDIYPLLSSGLGEGDSLYLYSNPLNSDSLNDYIPQLVARGVTVYYDVPSNSPPVINTVTGPIAPVVLNTPVDTSATFSDPDTLDTHTAVWDWDDDTTSAGVVTEENGVGSVTGSHTYEEAGVYTVTLTVEDDYGYTVTSEFRYVVVYDPDGGFVTGGGWINSPEGAYPADPTQTGKANFGFVSKYKRGQSTPSGNTEFHFKAGGLNFHSSSYDWLIIAHHKAMYKGTGTINGEGNYGFMLAAIDEDLTPSTDVDLFRIKIWYKDTGEVIYDNQMGDDEEADPTTEIGGGSIKIHKD